MMLVFLLNLTRAEEICSHSGESVQKSIEIFQEFVKAENCEDTINKLREVNTLNLRKKEIQDLSPLVYAKKLRVLLLAQNQIADLSPIADLRIRWLDISHNPIEDLSPLSEMNSLETLWASHMKVKDVSPLQKLNRLRYVSLDANQLQDVRVLSELHHIEFLGLSQNEIEDFRVFKTHKNMFVLVKGNPVVHCPEKGSWVKLCREEQDQ